jgi:hypothetical protein
VNDSALGEHRKEKEENCAVKEKQLSYSLSDSAQIFYTQYHYE